jgi:hypothetical protein
MIRKFILLVILALPAISFAQGSCYPAGVVLLDTGRPASGASVRVCQAGSTGTPCTPAASLFTDPTLGTPLSGSPTVTTDAHGNFGFCAAAGLNYDLQVSGSGITTLTVKNLPLPPTSPVVAGSLTSSSANPANVGQIKLASTDCIDWRNNANSGNIQLCKNTSDQFTFSGALVSQTLVSPNTTGTDSGTETFNNKSLGSPTTTGTDSGTETLTNKTLQGAGSGNKITLLNSQDTLANLSGTGADQTVYTFTIPANTIQAGKGFRITYKGLNNSAVAATYKVVIGATTVLTVTTAAAANNHRIVTECFNNAATQVAQVSVNLGLDGTSVFADNDTASTENFANAVTVKITANQASGSIKPTKWFVELIQ